MWKKLIRNYDMAKKNNNKKRSRSIIDHLNNNVFNKTISYIHE